VDVVRIDSFEDQAGLLEACSYDIKALQQAGGLDEVIAQVERGDVAEMRKQYGPQGQRKGGRPEWKSLKVTVNKRERIYEQLVSEFNGDKDRFFEFFTISCNPELGEGGKRKRKRANVERQLRASNKVAEAIPRRDRDLKEEMASLAYRGEHGDFLQDLWDVRWAGWNRWEIWRSLGKEKY
jgi:hypothetical protein